MSIDELVRGANIGNGPVGQWTVVGGKAAGVTAGFQIRDGEGDRYVVKLDPGGNPELNSSAEFIGTMIFHAIGYHVVENYIVEMDPEAMVIEPGTTYTDGFGDEEEMKESTIKRMLRTSSPLPNGNYRVLASKFIEGRPIGGWRYFETRTDDPNDVIPHEQRREPRGLRIFAAWTNHDDTRAQNTMDTWIEDGGVHYVRHYLMDFGSCFGAGYLDLIIPNTSFDYWLDMGEMRRNWLGLGFRVPKYRQVSWPKLYPAVGRYESKAYDPIEWVADYPNPSFVRCTDRDAFWAAAIIMKFTEEELRAIVRAGQISDPEAEEYFIQTLLERQRKTAGACIPRINPLDEFSIEGSSLTFANLAEQYGFANPASTYKVTWATHDNQTGQATPLGSAEELTGTSISLPSSSGQYLKAEIATLHPDHPEWEAPVSVYLRQSGGNKEIVGIERQSGGILGRGR
jgi:hypothetical protein